MIIHRYCTGSERTLHHGILYVVPALQRSTAIYPVSPDRRTSPRARAPDGLSPGPHPPPPTPPGPREECPSQASIALLGLSGSLAPLCTPLCSLAPLCIDLVKYGIRIHIILLLLYFISYVCTWTVSYGPNKSRTLFYFEDKEIGAICSYVNTADHVTIQP